MTKFNLSIALCFLISINQLLAQSNCNCETVFDNLLIKIKENYIGYALTKNEIEKEYINRVDEFVIKTKNTNKESCTAVLQDFLRFFKDGHLFVSEIPKYSAEQLEKFKSEVKLKMYSIQDVKKYLIENKSYLTDIEGIWTDGDSRFAIIKNNNPAWSYQYAAVILNHTQPEKIGELKFGVNLKEDRYEGTYFTNSYASRYVLTEVNNNNSTLSIWGGILWGRVNFSDINSIETIPLFNPALPTVAKLDKETALLTIPTFLIDKKDFDKVLIANAGLLIESKYLIIDIRGNNGGNGIYFDLLSLYTSRPIVSEIGLAISSPDNISYFQKFSSGNENNPYVPVVEDMKKSPGEIVVGPRYSEMKLNPMQSKIEKVAILTNEDNMSAAEAFILQSKQASDKVITIGRNTKGVIDYQSINMVKLGCESRGIHFGYPTSTSNKEIPRNGYNQTGIKPDILSEKISTELITFAQEQLRK